MCQDVGKWFVGKTTLLDAESTFQICRLWLLFSCCFCASLWIIIRGRCDCLSRCCTGVPWKRKRSSCPIPSENDAVRNLFQGLFDLILVLCFVGFFLFFFFQSLSSFTNVSTCLFVWELYSLPKLGLATALLSLWSIVINPFQTSPSNCCFLTIHLSCPFTLFVLFFLALMDLLQLDCKFTGLVACLSAATLL